MTRRAALRVKAVGFASLAAAVSIVNCAYFNTFYNASTAYRNARTAHQEFLRETADSAAALPPAIIIGYDTAIAKSRQVIDEHPRHKRWHDDALFLMARAYYYRGDYTRTVRRMEQLQQEFPASKFIPESYLYVGKAYLADGLLGEAEEALTFVLNRYPELNKDEEVSLLLAQIALGRQGRALAIELLQKVRNTTKDEVRRIEITLQIADLYVDMKLFDKAIATLKGCPRRKDVPHLMFRIDYALASCYLAQDSLGRALTVTEIMLADRAYNKHKARILYRKATILHALNQVDKAILSLEKITTDFPTDSVVGDAWFELGSIYQMKKADYLKAKDCYTKAASLSKSEHTRQVAQQRVAAIDKILTFWKSDSLKRTVSVHKKPDTTKAVRDTSSNPWLERFRIGEVFWLGLEQPDSALKYYRSLAYDTSVRADSMPKALFAAGWIARNVLLDTTDGDSLLHALVLRYPASEYAKAAQQALDAEVTVTTRADSAHVAFSESEQFLLDKEDPEDAVKSYLAAYDAFPNEPYGQKALYAAAWLTDNVLEKNKTAYDLYQKLCVEHPTSEYCVKDAKIRVQVVSDTLRVRKARRKAQERDGVREVPRKAKAVPVSATTAPAPAQPDSAAADTASSRGSEEVLSPDTADGTDSLAPVPIAPDTIFERRRPGRGMPMPPPGSIPRQKEGPHAAP